LSWKKVVGAGCALVLVAVLAAVVLIVWFVRNHRPVEAHGGPVGRLALTSDGRTLVSWGEEGVLKVWDVAAGTLVRSIPVPKDRDLPETVTALAVAPVGSLAAVGFELPPYEGGWKVGLVVFDLAAGREVRRMEVDQSVGGLAFSPDGTRLVVGCAGGAMRVYDTATWEMQEKGAERDSAINALAFLPDGNRLAVAYGKHGAAKGVRMLDLEQDTVLWDSSTEHIVHALSFSRDFSTLAAAVGSEDESSRPTGGIQGDRMWSGTEVTWYQGSAGSRNSVLVLDAESGGLRRELKGHRDWVLDVALSPDGQRAVSVGRDGTVRLWDVRSGLESRPMKAAYVWGARMAQAHAVVFLPDGRQAITGHGAESANDDTIRVWDLDTGAEVRKFAGEER